MSATSIEWTDKVWNPVTGCTKVSQSCKNCYAEGIADRFFAKQYPPNADGSLRKFTDVRCHEDRLEQPLHWKTHKEYVVLGKPRPKQERVLAVEVERGLRIFVNSMSDLFHEDVPFEFIDKVFAAMGKCPQHTFQILSKRPARMLEYAKGILLDWSNVWLGVSVEDQATADERIPLLLQAPAAVRWVSYEPALGPVNFATYLRPEFSVCGLPSPADPEMLQAIANLAKAAYLEHGGALLDWIVCGGESGPGARPMHPDWARSVRDQCVAAGVPFLFKQWGEYCPQINYPSRAGEVVFQRDPQEKRDRSCPLADGTVTHRLGKKAAGRLLDGCEWNEYPPSQKKAGR